VSFAEGYHKRKQSALFAATSKANESAIEYAEARRRVVVPRQRASDELACINGHCNAHGPQNIAYGDAIEDRIHGRGSPFRSRSSAARGTTRRRPNLIVGICPVRAAS
jgi:hypothetical protein